MKDKGDDDRKKAKVIQLFGDKTKPKAKTGGPKKTQKNKVVAKGQNNIAIGEAGGDINIIINHGQKPQPRTNETPPSGSVTDAHRQQLKDLVAGIVKNTGNKLSYSYVWTQFHRKFKIPVYQNLPESRYEEARKWLMHWYGSTK